MFYYWSYHPFHYSFGQCNALILVDCVVYLKEFKVILDPSGSLVLLVLTPIIS